MDQIPTGVFRPIPFKKIWRKLEKTPITMHIDQEWVFTFVISRLLICKHLIQRVHPVPSVFFPEAERFREAPFWRHKTSIPLEEYRQWLRRWLFKEGMRILISGAKGMINVPSHAFVVVIWARFCKDPACKLSLPMQTNRKIQKLLELRVRLKRSIGDSFYLPRRERMERLQRWSWIEKYAAVCRKR